MNTVDAGLSSGRLVMLTFHGLGEPGRVVPDGELDVWLEPRDFCAVLDAVRDRDDVAVTFDDGNLSDVEIALPALLARDIRGVFFPTAATLGQPGYLHTDDVRALADAGMTVGTHGMQHRSWSGMSADVAREELVEARQRLADASGREIEVAACPYGRYDRGALAQLRRSGYAHVVNSDGGATTPQAWLQARNTMRRSQDRAAVLHQLLEAKRTPWHDMTRGARLWAKRWR